MTDSATEAGTEAATATAAELASRPFDELIAELQRVVQALEAGSLQLEESIRLYRRGLELHAACEARLKDAELTISQLGRGLVEDESGRGEA